MPDRRVRSVVLTMRDCVDARQKSQECCFNNEGLCGCQTEESKVLF